MITGYIPGYRRNGGDDRRGDGIVIHSDKGHGYTLIVDGFDGTEPSRKLIQYCKQHGYTTVYELLTHAHYDHYKGLRMINTDKAFTVKKLYTVDPESIAHGIGPSANGRAVKADYDALKRVISEAQAAGADISYLKSGKKVAIGDIRFQAWRKQPTQFTEYDDGEAYAFINDGSLCLYFRELLFLTTGDGPHALKDALAYVDAPVVFCKVPHHGNSCSQSNAAALKAAECRLAYQTNNEKDGPGTTEFTAYGSRRVRQAGIPVIQLDEDITFTADKGKLTVKQGNKTWTFSVPYTGTQTGTKTQTKTETKTATAHDGLFRVRKTWADAGSQVGAYRNPALAIKRAKEGGAAFEVYDDYGVPVYPDALRTGWYRVRKTWRDAGSQLAACKYLETAINIVDKHDGYRLFDDRGRLIYPV